MDNPFSKVLKQTTELMQFFVVLFCASGATYFLLNGKMTMLRIMSAIVVFVFACILLLVFLEAFLGIINKYKGGQR